MTVSFIVPLYNGLAYTQAMLASLQATLPAGLSHEIILVDDDSRDGTRPWLESLRAPVRSLLNARNLGFAATCNHGSREATGEILVFLNNDLVLEPGWLAPLLAVFATHPDAGVVGNVQRDATTGAVDHAGLTFNVKGKPEHIRRQGFSLQTVRDIIAVTGACFAIRRASWLQLGGFDEAYQNGGEDVDLCLRARELGHRNFVVLNSVVRHHVSASPGRKLRDEQNSARLMRRWQHVIVPHITHLVARACLAASWEEPRDYVDPQLARESVLHAAGIIPATPRIEAAARTVVGIELARWAHLLDGAPPREAREIAPALFPLEPERNAET